MGEQNPITPAEAVGENQTPTPAEIPVQVFDFDALKEQFLVKKTWGTLSALDEVELGFMIQDGLHAHSVLTTNQEVYLPLDPNEQAELRAQVSAGNMAFEIFVRANEGMIRKIAYAVRRHHHDLPRLESADLRQQARMHLTSSIRNFDPTMSVKFSSYAQQYIYTKLLSYARDKGRLIRASRSMADKADQFRALVLQGRTQEEASERVGVSVDALLAAESAAKWPDAITYDVSYSEDDSSGESLIEVLAGPHEDTPHDELIADAHSANVAVNALKEWVIAQTAGKIPGWKRIDPDRNYKIMEDYYLRGKSPADIAEEWDIQKQRVWQIVREGRNPAHMQTPSNQDPERAYKLLIDHYVHGKSYAELGRQWGITGKRVSQIIEATRKIVKTQLPPEIAAHIEASGFSTDA